MKVLGAIISIVAVVLSIFVVIKFIPLNHSSNTEKHSTSVFFDEDGW